mmetsp:Transcript_40571/g.121271  ORF Transcript_40571/g.121271 Transcript_40571/m.121271 type:complete len:269 (+) Transcript_40571:553-1359(+)
MVHPCAGEAFNEHLRAWTEALPRRRAAARLQRRRCRGHTGRPPAIAAARRRDPCSKGRPRGPASLSAGGEPEVCRPQQLPAHAVVELHDPAPALAVKRHESTSPAVQVVVLRPQAGDAYPRALGELGALLAVPDTRSHSRGAALTPVARGRAGRRRRRQQGLDHCRPQVGLVEEPLAQPVAQIHDPTLPGVVKPSHCARHPIERTVVLQAHYNDLRALLERLQPRDLQARAPDKVEDLLASLGDAGHWSGSDPQLPLRSCLSHAHRGP